MIARRSFLTGFASLIAAPAIVRASSLMPVKAMPVKAMLYDNAVLREWLLPSGPWKMIGNDEVMPLVRTGLPAGTWRMINMGCSPTNPDDPRNAVLSHWVKTGEVIPCHS